MKIRLITLELCFIQTQLLLLHSRNRCFGFTSPHRARMAVPVAVGTKKWQNANLRQNPFHSQTTDDDYEEWDAGDVYQDLDRLEQAIAFSNADQDLMHKDRLETMDYFAAQRRLLQRDIKRLVLIPTALSFFLTIALKIMPGRTRLWKVLDFSSGVHFWLLTVLAPSMTWFAKLWTERQGRSERKAELPLQLRNMGPEYDRYLSRFSTPRGVSHVQDRLILFLEQWVVAVAGVALTSGMIPSEWDRATVAFRALTRLSVVASNHQYQQLRFQLHRMGQPRPLPASIYATQTLVRWQWMPWMFGLDLSLVVARLHWSVALGALGLCTAAPGLLSFCPGWVASRPWDKIPVRRYSIVACLALAWRATEALPRSAAFASSWAFRDLTMTQISTAFGHFRGTLFVCCVVAAALLGPVCHIVAALRLLRITRTHDISLAVDVEEFQEQLEDEERHQWRYRLRWRDPKPIMEVVEEWRRGFWHWFLFAGSVDETVRQQMQSQRQREVEQRGLLVWQRVAKELERNPDAPRPDRRQWKGQAMDRMASKLQSDYDRENFEDPLGIVVHQTFGIGLGFNFDHMRKLEPGEKPSVRRLQARAAKSAIRRAREIYNAASAKQILDKIEDPRQRDRKAEALRREADMEIQSIARRLTELLPTNLSMGEKETTSVQQFQASRSFVKTSNNQYLVSSPIDESPTVEQLRRSLLGVVPPPEVEVDYMNPSGEPKDDEFIEAWENQGSDADDSAAHESPPEARLA